jgi:hypothetical protein
MGVPGGDDLIPERRVKVRQEEELEDKLAQDQAGRLGNLGVKGKPLSAQEQEATKDDDAEIPYHLCNSRLEKLWDSQLLPPSIEQPAEVLRQQFALRFWKMTVWRSFFAWFGNEYHFRVKHKKVAVWNGTKYSRNEKHKLQYRHYWSSIWGHTYNDQRKSLLAACDCIERAANSSWWDWEDGSRPFFWRWSVEYQNQIRDGIPLWYHGTAPRNFLSKRKEKDPEVRQSMGAKLMKVFARRYFIYKMILSFPPYQTGQGMGHAKEFIMGDPNDDQNVYQWREVQLNLPGLYRCGRNVLKCDRFS